MASLIKEPRTLPELFFLRTQVSANEEAVIYKKHDRWNSLSWKDLESQVRQLGIVTADWIQHGDRVCILSENRPEWWVADLTILGLGGVSVPIYATNPAKDIAYIVNDCQAQLIFVSNQLQLDKIRSLKKNNKIDVLKRVIVFDEVPDPEDWVLPLGQLKTQNGLAEDPIASRMQHLQKEDLATLIYTSGTTGEPKGVMLTHWNMVSNALGAEQLIQYLDLEEKLMLSFLPLSHSFERTAGYYGAIYMGFKVAFAESIEKLVDNMGEVRPTMLVSVPRIYEKLYARVMESAQSPIKKKLITWSLMVGKEHAQYRITGREAPRHLEAAYEIATAVVFSKLHKRMGGRLKYAISGGAPLAVEIAKFLNAIGLSVFEGYGLSETAPILTANLPGKVKVGSVGTPWPQVEIKIEPEPDRDRDGEILARGPNIMRGYFNKPEATAEVLSQDGWFRTGDIGYIDRDGYLFITDRKKELIKTAGGKYVAPQPIENQLKVHQLVEQAVVIGDRRKYCVALLVPSLEALENTLGRPLPADKHLLNEDPQVRSLYQAAIDEVNKDLGSWEQIKRFQLLPAEMTQQTGELTPTMKIKRRVVDQKYKEAIDSLYPPD